MAAGRPFGGFLTEMAAMESDDQEFEEEDIWGDAFKTTPKRSSSRQNSVSPRRLAAPATQRSIPSRSTSHPELPVLAPRRPSSAPINIPDWAKILRKPWVDVACNDFYGCGRRRRHPRYLYDADDEGEEEDEEEGMIPPHEFIARRNARRRIASFSMCEGTGKTLKGRDLSKLRNTILSKTGFLE